MKNDLEQTIEFHGHCCPGLVMGYRVAKFVKGHYKRSDDEELVCIAENNSCSIDAIQEILGCTAGKGNLILKNYGKQAFTFYSRDHKKAMRIYFKDEILDEMSDLRQKYFQSGMTDEEKKEFERWRERIVQQILDAKDEEVLSVKEVDIPAPEKARIYPSLRCQDCGESFMEILGRTANGKIVCKDCFRKLTC